MFSWREARDRCERPRRPGSSPASRRFRDAWAEWLVGPARSRRRPHVDANPGVDDVVAIASVPPGFSARRRSGRARSLYVSGWLFTRALAIEPESGGAAYGLGLALDGFGHPDDAAVRYRDAIRLDPAHWRAHNNLGVYLLRHGELDTALYHFSEAVRLNPAARDATDNLRVTLAATGFTKEHADGYLQALVTWSAAIASDQQTVGAAAYGARLASALLASRAALFQSCAGKGADDGAQPFSLYLQIDANGVLTAVTVVPPVAAARCLRDELRTAHAPSPPFAPFHASVVVPPVEG
jgi:Tetratricopeptide repeat